MCPLFRAHQVQLRLVDPGGDFRAQITQLFRAAKDALDPGAVGAAQPAQQRRRNVRVGARLLEGKGREITVWNIAAG